MSDVVAKQPHPNVPDWFANQPPETVYLSVITIGEITKGIQKMPLCHRRTALETWLNQSVLIQFQHRIIPIDLATMVLWGELTGKLEPQGRMLPTMDSLIAALQHALTLVIRNEKDFAGTGLTIFNPWT